MIPVGSSKRKYSDFFIKPSELTKSIQRTENVKPLKFHSTKDLLRDSAPRINEMYKSFEFIPYKIKDFHNFSGTRSFKSNRVSPDLNCFSEKKLKNRPVKGKKIRIKSSSPAQKREVTPECISLKYESLLNLKELIKLQESPEFCQLEDLNAYSVKHYLETSAERRENNEKMKRINMRFILESSLMKDYEESSKTEEKKRSSINVTVVKSLIYQFDLPPEIRDYEALDNILNTLDFFKKFLKDTRKKLYRFAEMAHFLPDQIIFRKGDIGNFIYIVVKGSVSIEKLVENDKEHKMIVSSIYDGKHFGEIISNNLNKDSRFRHYTCIASEDTYCIQIEKDDYKCILLDDQKEEIQKKVQFLRKIELFSSIPKESLAIIATNVSLIEYELDDIILKEGDIPKGLYIIYSGYAKLYTQGFRLQGLENPFLNASKREKFFRRGRNQQDSIIRRALINNIGPLTPRALQKVKYFTPEYDRGTQKKGVLTKDYLEFGNLYSKDYFGGRVLLKSNENDPNLASKFTIIAKSAKLEIIIIDKDVLHNFSDDLVILFKDTIEKSLELDCPEDKTTSYLNECLATWQNYKRDLTESISKEKFIDRHKNIYPFIRK